MNKRIFIVSDSVQTRKEWTSIVAQFANISVCGQSNCIASALAEIENLIPRILFLDTGLDLTTFSEHIETIQDKCPHMVVFIVPSQEATLARRNLGEETKRISFFKQMGSAQVKSMCLLLSEGHIASPMKHSSSFHLRLEEKARNDEKLKILSDREIEVFLLLGQGYQAKMIAEMLDLSPKTVNAHCMNIKFKLALHDTRQVVHAASTWRAKAAS